MIYFESYGWKWDKYRDDWKEYYASILAGSANYDLRINPFYVLYGGYVYFGSLQYAGSGGLYWSSTAYNASQAYDLYFNSSSVNPSTNYYCHFGFSIRCLAR